MRALCLLLLCVVLLATLQASYLVVDAKKHTYVPYRMTDDADQGLHASARANKLAHHKPGKKEEKEDPFTPPETADEKHTLGEYDVMMGDQPAAESAAVDQPAVDQPPQPHSRSERVSKEERKKEKKEKKKERKERRKERKNHKGGKKTEEVGEKTKAEKKQARQEKKKAREERQEERESKRQEKKQRKEDRKEKKKQKKGGKGQKVTCATDGDCGDNECCVPRGKNKMMCRANKRPRALGRKCYSDCTCDQDLRCYAENDNADANKKHKKFGECVKPENVNLSNGNFLSYAAPPTEAPPA